MDYLLSKGSAGADQTLSSIPVATCSVPMSTALQAPITTLSNTTYGMLYTVSTLAWTLSYKSF